MKILAWIVGVPVGAFVLLVVVKLIENALGPDDAVSNAKWNSRSAIELCWEEQAKKSNNPADSRSIAGVCEKMESDFKKNHGVNP